MHTLGEHSRVKTELYQTNAKSQHATLINAYSKRLISNKNCIIIDSIMCTTRQEELGSEVKIITTVLCSMCSQLNSKL